MGLARSIRAQRHLPQGGQAQISNHQRTRINTNIALRITVHSLLHSHLAI